MDQFASVFGKQGCLIRLDCRSLEYEYFPFDPQGYKLVLINSMVKHSLGNEYNERRESCEKAVALMNREFGGVETLRDANYQIGSSLCALASSTKSCPYFLSTS